MTSWENGGGESKMYWARRALRVIGWTTTRRDGKIIDVCPRCHKKQKAGKLSTGSG